jgi:outer membrane protein TolC
MPAIRREREHGIGCRGSLTGWRSQPEHLHNEIPQAQNDLTTKFIRNRSGPAESDELRQAKARLADLREQEVQAKAEYKFIMQQLNGV